MKTIIIGAGRGRRLMPTTADTPKCYADIQGHRMLDWALRAFAGAGIKVQAKVLGAWDQPEMWERVIAAGADWLQTDLPEEVLAHALWRRLPTRPEGVKIGRAHV